MEAIRARNPLPTGAASIGVGLSILGVTSYAFLVIAGRALGAADLAPLSSLWALAFTIGPGVFMPLEQEVSRLVASRTARGEGITGAVRRIGAIGLAMATGLALVTLLTSPLTFEPIFASNVLLLVGLLLAIAGFAGEHLLRGVLSGIGRFRRYAVVLATEGTTRLAICAALAIGGVSVAGPYGAALGAAPLLAVGSAYRLGIESDPGRTPRWSEVSGALGWLLTGSVLAQALTNAPLLAAPLLADADQQAVVGAFLASFVVAKVPVFAFAAVQAALLPQLSRMAAEGRQKAFQVTLKKLVVLVVMVGGIATVGAWLLGPWLVRTLFGNAFALERRDLALLAAGASSHMVAIAYAQGLIALGNHARAAAGFMVGLAVTVAGFAFGTQELLLRLEVGFLAGTAAAAVAMACWMRSSR